MRYNIIFGAASLATSVYALTPDTIPGMNVIWSDDFSGDGGFDTTKWQYYTGGVTNNEQETYPQSGEYCKLSGSGSLLIQPERTGDSWASCRIETVDSWAPPTGGMITFASKFKYGTSGASLQGAWPAFWALGDSMRNGVSWPTCGEIDTFESVNGEGIGHGTLHCGNVCDGFTGIGQSIPTDITEFHTWSHTVDFTSTNWEDQSITWYLDGQPYNTITGQQLGNQDDVVNTMQKAMYITLNVAMGGQWPGNTNDATASGADAGMEIQYVAVYTSGGS